MFNLHAFLRLAIVRLLVPFVSHAQSFLDRRIDLGKNEAANALIQTSDRGYLLVGEISGPGLALSDFLVVKTNAMGKIFKGLD